jgi:hypothetical protein
MPWITLKVLSMARGNESDLHYTKKEEYSNEEYPYYIDDKILLVKSSFDHTPAFYIIDKGGERK